MNHPRLSYHRGISLLITPLVVFILGGCEGSISIDGASVPARTPGGPDSSNTPDDPSNPNPSQPPTSEDPDPRDPSDPIEEPVIPPNEDACVSDDFFFERDVWTQVALVNCVGCHNGNGIAADSRFVLENKGLPGEIEHNTEVFRELATTFDPAYPDEPLLIAKPLNHIEHDGGVRVQEGSPELEILREFIERIDNPVACEEPQKVDFLEGIALVDPYTHLYRTSLSLVGRLPTKAEAMRIEMEGQQAMPNIIDAMMSEDGFYFRLKEAFNDILLTDAFQASFVYGGDGRSYPCLGWFREESDCFVDLGDFLPFQLAQRSSYGFSRAPVELIAHIAREERPFTEVLTADYTMVNPFSARSYDVFDQVDWNDPLDVDEFHPVRLSAVETHSTDANQYVHAGILTQPVYLARYPSTETNRNRHRASLFYKHFLNVDILELAPRGGDATDIVQYEIPEMQASQCNVCHVVMDPVAGAFEEYNDDGHIYPRKEGWFTDMYEPGFNGETIPEDDRWRGLAWLGERAAQDPRFVNAVLSHVHYMVFGRNPIERPTDPTARDFNALLQAYNYQQETFQEMGQRFVESNYNLKSLIKDFYLSPQFRAANIDQANATPERLAALKYWVRPVFLTPEQLARKLETIFGEPWMAGTNVDALRSENGFNGFYGGLGDYLAVTQRLTTPNGLMGALQRYMANFLPCTRISPDFAKPADQRALFPYVDRSDLPDTARGESRIRENLVYLHEVFLGEILAPDSAKIDQSFELFRLVQQDGQQGVEQGRYERDLVWACRRGGEGRDPEFTARAWRAVLSYLMSTYEFLYLY